MKIDGSCVKAEMKKLSRAVREWDRPVIRKRIDAEWGIYGDRNAAKPIVSLDIDGEWCYKLSCALKILAVLLTVMWFWGRICRWMRRMF